MKQIHFLLVLFVFFTSCKGQIKNRPVPEKGPTCNEQTTFPKARNAFANAFVYCAIQDRAGNFWFGTNNEGLFRYDGKNFVNFTQKDGLDTNNVSSIFEDKSGNIWVGTQGGLNCYDPSTSTLTGGKTFTHIPLTLNEKSYFLSNNSNTDSPHLNWVWSIMQDKSGKMWFGTDDGVFCYDRQPYSVGGLSREAGMFIRFPDNNIIINKDSLKLRGTFTFLEDRAGGIWFGTCNTEGICRFDGKTLTTVVPRKDVGRVNRAIEDKKGIIWFTTTLGYVCRYDGKSFAINYFNKKDGEGDLILEDKSGNMWFDTREGLGFYDGQTLKILTEKDGLPNKNIVPLFEDNSGKLWFSGAGIGLFRYDGKVFTNFSQLIEHKIDMRN